MNLVLTGYKCSGKTTVGRLLAERFKRKFIDVDSLIEEKTGFTIREIFELKGEEYFRILEEEAIKMVYKTNAAVISLGGGAIMLYRNVKRMSENGVIFYLAISVQTALERIRNEINNTRRYINQTDLENNLKAELTRRLPYYESGCNYKVTGDDKRVDQVADEITNIINQVYGNADNFFERIP